MANGQNQIPKLTGKDQINLQKKTVYTMSCPKCDKDIDVTTVNPNTYIECGNCQNVTWRPDYSPPWWAKTRNFVLSLVGALALGIVTGVISDLIVDKYQTSNSDKTTNQNNLDSLRQIFSDSVRQHITDSLKTTKRN